MSNTFSYQSDNYDRETQRFVVPLYIKDNSGIYEYSSTATLVKYNEHHYILFAAHALSENIGVDNIYIFLNNGSFQKIIEPSIGHKIFDKDDIVIIDYFNAAFDGKNYFNLNLNNLSGFDKNHFAWTGFPRSQTKSKKIFNTKSIEELKDEHVHSDATGTYFTKAKYLTILSKIISNDKCYIKGEYNRNEANLKYKGLVRTAPLPIGMSGGAMYFFSEGQKLKENLDDTFRFAGIGIEYHKDNTIIGVSRDKVIELIDIFDKENPVQLIFK